MIKITNIKQLDSNKFAVIIDNKKHIILGDVLLELNILKPCEININTYNKIISSNNYYAAYSKILKFIMTKMRTEKEIKDKLTKLNVNVNDQKKILQKLKEERFLDDERYVASFINDQINLTVNGPKKILFELKKLNFSEDLINKYLSNITNDIWDSKIKKIIQKKQNANHTLSKNKFISKIKLDLNNLGYSENDYAIYLNNISFDDKGQMLKDYQKYYRKYSQKYQKDKLDLMLKEKLYSLGYNLDNYEQIKETNFSNES